MFSIKIIFSFVINKIILMMNRCHLSTILCQRWILIYNLFSFNYNFLTFIIKKNNFYYHLPPKKPQKSPLKPSKSTLSHTQPHFNRKLSIRSNEQKSSRLDVRPRQPEPQGPTEAEKRAAAVAAQRAQQRAQGN